MSSQILYAFSESPDLLKSPTLQDVDYLEQYCVYFETKNDHPLALNSQTLGIHKIYFLEQDRSLLFQIAQVNESDLRQIIKQIDAIDTTRIVTSDAYNHLCIWLVHRLLTSTILEEKDIYRGCVSLLKMLHYKFFTSKVNQSFKHGANPAVMEATVKGLSNKYEVIQLGSWKKVIEKACTDILIPTSLHYNTFIKYNDDKKILYILSNLQTAIGTKVVNVAQEYYKNHEEGGSIDTYNNVGSDSNGEKIITASTNVLDLMISSMSQQIQSSSRFINTELIRVLCDMFAAIKEDVFTRVLNMFVEKAILQANNHELESFSTLEDGTKIYIGCNLLIRELIQKTYRYCTINKVDLSNKSAILTQVKNVYGSSRANDPDIVTIKLSCRYFVDECGESVRNATNASLTIAFILYVIIRTFDYL